MFLCINSTWISVNWIRIYLHAKYSWYSYTPFLTVCYNCHTIYYDKNDENNTNLFKCGYIEITADKYSRNTQYTTLELT